MADVDWDDDDDLDNDGEINDKPTPPDSKTVRAAAKAWEALSAQIEEKYLKDGTKQTRIKATKMAFVSALIHLDGANFNFKGREYLEPIYNRQDNEILMKNARQTEKTCLVSSPILMRDGTIRRADAIQVGDFVSTLNTGTQKIISGEIIWRSRIYRKPCLRIKTRQGHDIEVASTHPIRMWERWVPASEITIGSKVACVKKAGEFGTYTISDEKIELVAFMVGDGYCPKEYQLSFTQNPGPILDRFQECASREIPNYCVVKRKGGTSYDVKFPPPKFMEELVGRNSYTHEIPEWVFGLNEKQTALFINRLWACDGHIKRRNPTLYDLVYASMSKKLVRQLQSLLWKFGIPSAIRENLPNVYKTAYLLRVETAQGVHDFLTRIGSLGKSENILLPDLSLCNNNRYTFPLDLSQEIAEAIKTTDITDTSLRMMNLCLRPTYCLTVDKAKRYCGVLKSLKPTSNYAMKLQAHLESDIYWDVVESIEDISEQDCIDFEVKDHHNFIIDGVITHNSTYLSNALVIDSLVRPFNKSLYVSPSHIQTRQFSSEKLKPIIENSPLIRSYFQDSSVSQQVFEKGFRNGSFIFLRSAYRSADRCLPYDALVLLADGTHKQVSNISVGDKLIAYNGTCTENVVSGKECNGQKPIGKVILLTGHELEATHNHRFITDSGIKRLDQLTTDDYIPIPTGWVLPGEGRPEDLWLGLMVSDGCMRRSSKWSRCQFCNNDLALIELFGKLSAQLGISELRRNTRKNKDVTNYVVAVRSSKESRELLNRWGLDNTGNETKFIPEECFINEGRISSFLKGYFEGNGWVTWNEKSRQCEVGCVTASENVARGILRGLQSLGVMAILETWEKSRRSSSQKMTYFYIKIRNVQNIRKFSDRVGLLTKQEKLDKLLLFADSLLATSAREIDVPARDDCAASLQKAGISSHKLWTEHGISFRSNIHTKKLIAKHKVQKIYELTGDEALTKWLTPNVEWIPVRKVDLDVGVKETYDIEVLPDHVFNAGGMFTHNTRGISARNLYIDELQDMLLDQVPVIRECTSHFHDATTIFAGTPKSLNNTIEVYWKTTTQNEWLVPCRACNKWNFLDEKNIAPTVMYMEKKLPPGPVCKYCGKPIDVTKGKWISLSPGKNMMGYRVPQLMVPWICGLFGQWVKLLWKRDHYPISQFNNEVLGLSYDSSSSPITQEELVSICGQDKMWDLDRLTSDQVNFARGQMMCAGVDWGEGVDGAEKSPGGKIKNASYTVLTVGYYINQKTFKVIAMKKFTGKEVDPEYQVDYIAKIFKLFGMSLMGVDYGHGWGVNNTLVRLLGAKHVVMFQYVHKLKERLKWDPISFRYVLHRNFMISEFFYDLKNGHVELPKWSDFEPFSKDVLAIYKEYDDFKREVRYDHKASEPDDGFHSLLLCKLATDIFLGKSRRYTARQEHV